MKYDFDSVDGSRTGDRIGSITMNELKMTVDMGEVLQRSCAEIIEHADIMPFVDESRHDMRANESCAAGYQIIGQRSALSRVITVSDFRSGSMLADLSLVENSRSMRFRTLASSNAGRGHQSDKPENPTVRKSWEAASVPDAKWRNRQLEQGLTNVRRYHSSQSMRYVNSVASVLYIVCGSLSLKS